MNQKKISTLAFSAGVLTAMALLVGQIAGASSTISTNISTGGTLSVTGAATFSSTVGIGSTTPGTTLGITGTTTTGGLVVGLTGNPVNTILMGTCTYPGATAIVGTTTLSQNCTGATGVRSGDRVFVTPRGLERNLIFTSASSTATNDVVQVSVYNTGAAGSITPSEATWSYMAIR